MTETPSAGTIWNESAKYGLYLGLITIAFLSASEFITPLLPTRLAGFFSFFLWLAKFSTCVWFLRWSLVGFNTKFGDGNIDRGTLSGFGVRTVFFSALIVAAFMLAYYTIIRPDAIAQQLQDVMQSMSSYMDSNSQEEMESMLTSGKMPVYVFFAQLVYCFLFGAVCNSIFVRSLKPNNPFQNSGKDAI